MEEGGAFSSYISSTPNQTPFCQRIAFVPIRASAELGAPVQALEPQTSAVIGLLPVMGWFTWTRRPHCRMETILQTAR